MVKQALSIHGVCDFLEANMKKIIFLVCLSLGTKASYCDSPEEVIWLEDGQERRAYVVPDLIADFSPSRGSREKNRIAIGAKKKHEGRGSSIFQLSSKMLSSGNVRLGVGQSPIFTSTKGANAWMALPGGAVVTFAQPVSVDDAEAWATKNGVEIDSGEPRTSEMKKVWLVRGDAGLESIALSTRLSSAKGIVGAAPNWWIHVVAKSAPEPKSSAKALRRAWQLDR